LQVAQPAGDERCTDYFNRKSIEQIVREMQQQSPSSVAIRDEERWLRRNRCQSLMPCGAAGVSHQ
jgi:hypothetical protein